MGRRLAKLALTATLAFGLFKAVDAAAPAPSLTPIFNTANDNATPGTTPAREYRLESLPAPDAAKKDLWRVRIGSWEMAAGGHHTFLEFSPVCAPDAGCRDRNDVYQIHGIAMDETRQSYAQLDFMKLDSYKRYESGDYVLKALGVNQDYNRHFFRQQPDAYVDVFYGSKEDVLKLYLAGMKIVDNVNKNGDPYLLFEHNSNSVQHTLLQGLGLEMPPLYVDHKLTALGGRIWCPGIGLSLLPEGWSRDRVLKDGAYNKMSVDELEKAARKLSGPERMFATFKPLPKAPPPHGPAA